MENKFCEKCGNKLEEGQEFCSKCGNKFTITQNDDGTKNMKSNKKNIITIVIISVLIICGIVAGLIIKNNNDKERAKEELERAKEELEKSIEKYKSDAFTFGVDVLISLTNLESVGNDIKSYWYDFIYEDKYSSINDAVDKALEKNKNIIDSLSTDREKIEKDYKSLLKLPDENNSELIEIKEAIKDLYSDYYDFYELVVTPSGNYTKFSSEFLRLDSSGLKKYNALSDLLGY